MGELEPGVDQAGIAVGIVLDRGWKMVLGESLRAAVDTGTDNFLLFRVVRSLEEIPDHHVVQILCLYLLLLHPYHYVHHLPYSQQIPHHSHSNAAADSPGLQHSPHYWRLARYSWD